MALRLNLSNQEAESKPRSFSPLPSGEYLCNIVEIQEKTVKETAKNAGRPYWNIRFVVDQGDQYDGRNIFANVMLFEGALYSIKQLVEAVFPDMVDGNDLTVPDADAFEGKQVVVVGLRYPAGSKEKKTGRVREQDEFDVRGYKSSNVAAKKAPNSSLLPS